MANDCEQCPKCWAWYNPELTQHIVCDPLMRMLVINYYESLKQ